MAEKTAAGLVAWCRQNIGMPYWYCSQGQKPTAAWLEEKIRQYPKKWNPARIAKARSEVGRFARCFDCVGLIKGYLWVQPDGRIRCSAKHDKTADGMRAVSSPQPIATLPEIPGVLAFMDGHVGVYVGGGRVIESYGFKNVADRPLGAQRWTTWGRCPYIEYPDTIPAEDAEGLKIGDSVRIKADAVYYYPGGVKIPGWLKGQVKTVDQVLVGGRAETRGGEQCVLLDRNGINSWISTKNVERVEQ